MTRNNTSPRRDGLPKTSAGLPGPFGSCARRRSQLQELVRWIVFLMTVVAAVVVVDPANASDAPTLSEYQVKALFLFNFTKYVDWPTNTFSDDSAPIVIGVVGQDNFGDKFKQVIGDRTVNGRKVVVKRVQNADEFKGCQILFVSASEKARESDLLETLKDSAVLTVGETERFLTEEGMVNLVKKDNKIRVEINLTPAGRANLKLSSKLLGVADVVLGKPGGGK